ncbi:sugar phosphate nucleotidyltransferase [Pseudomonas turukhanskensis]|uniref:Nucleoside-diphosphate-sugar pyrophosphorylase n=1 Tax=Pseudomonas turukhanskensis TaxID=1806536 RepID=A0A9W6K2M4_9PSED|nr:sugar phosphate nucleotidyltransferase [Pseudomonas turukhanskensis]GLK87742.1 nucleoside-diphosphate-sugar pyrophosphorylase [Pseudomonas turukhanskensis]
MTITTAIILAGGLGTRLRSVVADRPKPMALIHGRPFLEWLMDYWIDQGIRRFILSVGYQHLAITEHFGSRYRLARLSYAIEPERLGTGGGLLLAARQLNDEDAFLVLNGDTFFAVDLPALDHFSRTHAADWSLALFRAGQADRYMGVTLNTQERIVALASRKSSEGYLANGGVYWVRTTSLAKFPSHTEQALSLEDELLPALLDSSTTLAGFVAQGTFIDIGVPEDYAKAKQLLLPFP